MQARIEYQGEVVIVHLSGRVDVETAEPFRKACLNFLKGKKVVFDFRSLGFVGSSGILPFLETMQDFAQASSITTSGAFHFSGVGSEFRKVFAATPLHVIQIFEQPAQAVHALLNPAAVVPPAGPAAPGLAAAVQAPLMATSHAHMQAQAHAASQHTVHESRAEAEFGFLSLKHAVPEGGGESLEDADE